MTCFEIKEKGDSYFRTLVYQTMFNNFIVLLRQKQNFDNFFETIDHTLLPVKFLPALNKLFSNANSQPAFLSNGYFCREEPAEVNEISCMDISFGVKRILFDYDSQVVTITNNQLGFYQALEEVGDFWGIQTTPDSPTFVSTTSNSVGAEAHPSAADQVMSSLLQHPTALSPSTVDTQAQPVVENTKTTPANTKLRVNNQAPKKRKLNLKL